MTILHSAQDSHPDVTLDEERSSAVGLVEARRVELLSEILSSGASPGAVSDWSIPLSPKPADRPGGPVAR
jgi:hypothetical protein